MNVAKMGFSGKTANRYVNARMVVHAIMSTDFALVNLDGLGTCVQRDVQQDLLVVNACRSASV